MSKTNKISSNITIRLAHHIGGFNPLKPQTARFLNSTFRPEFIYAFRMVLRKKKQCANRVVFYKRDGVCLLHGTD